MNDGDLAEKKASADQAIRALTGDSLSELYAAKLLPLAIAILVFGIVVLLLIAWTLRHTARTESVLTLFGVPLIIVAAVFLVVAGFSDKQISPVIGLLGTI